MKNTLHRDKSFQSGDVGASGTIAPATASSFNKQLFVLEKHTRAMQRTLYT